MVEEIELFKKSYHSSFVECNKSFEQNGTVIAKRIIFEQSPLHVEITSLEYDLKCREKANVEILNIVNCSQDDNIIISPLKNSTSDDDFLKIQCITSDCSKNEHFLLQKMFFRWLELTKNRKLLRKILLQWKITCLKKDSEVTTQKIDKFIETLQKRLEEKKINHATLHKENNRNTHGVQKSKSTVISPECHKSRFKAQQEIIELQKSKLVEQTKIIEDLKLGIIQDELEKSLKNTKNEIREIFSNCSNRIKCKTVPTEALIQNALANLIINSNKAPKFLQQMEKRALERAKNRQIILERKRLIDEEKKRLIREAIEKKQAQDEEEKKRNLEAIKERRRLDFELQKQRQINKEKYLASLKKAENYHRRKLLRTAIGSFLYNVYVAHNNHNKSESFYENKIKAKCFKAWIQFIENKYKPGFDKAITFCNAKLILKAFGVWKSFHKEAIRSLQVAIDYYDMQLATKTFIHWHRYVCIQITKRERNEQKAQKHYNSRILIHYFYSWRTLPAVLQLEKAKEEKKRKWREKVMEILPDYRPPNDDD